MPAVSITDLNNAKLDVDHMAALATSNALTATDRLGNTKKTWSGIEQDLGAAYAVTTTGANRIASEEARDIALAASDAAVATGRLYASTAEAQADAGLVNGSGYVAPLPDGSLQAYRKVSAAASTAIGSPFSSAAEMNYVLSARGKNLVDKNAIRRGYYYSDAAGAIIAAPAWRCTDFIAVEEGKTYRASGFEAGMVGMYFTSRSDTAKVGSAMLGQGSAFTVPAGAHYVVFNVTNDGQDVLTYDATAQIELGSMATAYEPFKRFVSGAVVEGLAGKLSADEILQQYSFNMIDPAVVDFTRRYSIGTKNFVTDSLLIAASDYIAVDEGQWYTLSGSALYAEGPAEQGGYFANRGDAAAIDNITFVSPVSGGGAAFQVPTGLGITHVVVSLKKTVAGSPSALNGIIQMERGEVPTAYQAYSASDKIKPSLLFDGDVPTPSTPGSLDAAAWFKYTAAEGLSEGHRFPTFRSHWIAKDKNLCVANTGTSLTARSTEHCTSHPQASTRPPLMHSHNMASLLWDKMRWEGQHYRRYDASGFFAESGGGWFTANALAEWDDGAYRDGLTRYSATTGAAVSFEVPIGAWQFNFIYRTDSVGVPTNTVAVAEGNGKMQAWDEVTNTWVEANGYTFSMVEATPVTRVISIPNPTTDVFANATIASKGNTTYQRRLKMRCLDRVATKAVTITGGAAGRFMYWGVEWSVRQYMITYINAARGSHNTQATGATGLPRFQDNEIWSFKPDLLLFELPIHNDGAAAAGSYAAGYWARLTNNFVFRADYELSLKTRGTFFGLAPEMGMFTSSIAWNFGGIEDDGTLKFGAEVGTGKMMTALDKFSEASQWVYVNHPEVPCINAAARWCEAGVAIHGNLRIATEGSGKGGETFTNEGSHWNDTGSKIIAKTVMPLLDFAR